MEYSNLQVILIDRNAQIYSPYLFYKMSNNELNQIIGQRWKEMSAEDKLPYLQLAEPDKLRYREVFAYISILLILLFLLLGNENCSGEKALE